MKEMFVSSVNRPLIIPDVKGVPVSVGRKVTPLIIRMSLLVH